MKFFNNKIIIITGASSGIGKEMALKLSHYSCHLILASRSLDELQNLSIEIRKNGSVALPLKCDVTEEKDVNNLIEKTVQQFGKIDILINNVGITSRALLEKTDLSVLKYLMDVNYWGAVNITQKALPYLHKSNGTVVAVSSVIGKVPVPGRGGYSAAKHALEGYFETLKMELRETNIKVLVIRPSYTNTPTRFNAIIENGQKQNFSTLDEGKLESPEIVATKILKGIKQNKHGLTLGKKMEGSWLILLYALMPKFISSLIYKKIKKEPHSLFVK